MKIGCFVRSILFLIVTIGIVSYLYKKYGNDLIESGKERIEVFVSEEIQNAIDKVSESDEIELKDIKLNSSEFNKLVKEFKQKIDTNKIGIKNIEELRKLIKEYEGTTKE